MSHQKDQSENYFTMDSVHLNQSEYNSVNLSTVRRWVALQDYEKIGNALANPSLVGWGDINFEEFGNYLRFHLPEEDQRDFDQSVEIPQRSIAMMVGQNPNLQGIKNPRSTPTTGDTIFLASYYMPIRYERISWNPNNSKERKQHIFRVFPYITKILSPKHTIAVSLRETLSEPFSIAHSAGLYFDLLRIERRIDVPESISVISVPRVLFRFFSEPPEIPYECHRHSDLFSFQMEG